MNSVVCREGKKKNEPKKNRKNKNQNTKDKKGLLESEPDESPSPKEPDRAGSFCDWPNQPSGTLGLWDSGNSGLWDNK